MTASCIWIHVSVCKQAREVLGCTGGLAGVRGFSADGTMCTAVPREYLLFSPPHNFL